jgi:hypothetical protein
MPEELAPEQVVVLELGAVDGDERVRAPVGEQEERAGKELLPDAAFAVEEDGAIEAGVAREAILRLDEGGMRPEHRHDAIRPPPLPGERLQAAGEGGLTIRRRHKSPAL